MPSENVVRYKRRKNPIKAEVVRSRGPQKGKTSYVRYFQSEHQKTVVLERNKTFFNSFVEGLALGVAEGASKDVLKKDKVPPPTAFMKMFKRNKKK